MCSNPGDLLECPRNPGIQEYLKDPHLEMLWDVPGILETYTCSNAGGYYPRNPWILNYCQTGDVILSIQICALTLWNILGCPRIPMYSHPADVQPGILVSVDPHVLLPCWTSWGIPGYLVSQDSYDLAGRPGMYRDT